MIKYQRMETDFADETPTANYTPAMWSDRECAIVCEAAERAAAREGTAERDRANLAAWNASRKSA